LAQEDLTGGAFGRQLLRARLAGGRRAQAVFRRHAERGGRDGDKLVRHHLGQADALFDRATGAQAGDGGHGQADKGDAMKGHETVEAPGASALRLA
jgi:hypothetical protein